MQLELGPVGQIVKAKLEDAFHPTVLELTDESNQHHGHVGAHRSGESHFRVKIGGVAFQGKSRVQQHRMVHDALALELKSRVHALAIEIVL
ncbi:MAG: BolA family transcriptional regulator [Alphaproteobacteria bacterium]|nr:BolA family transcriptional regulator [Alphaproteobacteria bacterium]